MINGIKYNSLSLAQFQSYCCYCLNGNHLYRFATKGFRVFENLFVFNNSLCLTFKPLT